MGTLGAVQANQLRTQLYFFKLILFTVVETCLLSNSAKSSIQEEHIFLDTGFTEIDRIRRTDPLGVIPIAVLK